MEGLKKATEEGKNCRTCKHLVFPGETTYQEYICNLINRRDLGILRFNYKRSYGPSEIVCNLWEGKNNGKI